jgi:hypothetical protein
MNCEALNLMSHGFAQCRGGMEHNLSSFAGLVVGEFNEISGRFASISGGLNNTASGMQSTISGGEATGLRQGMTTERPASSPPLSES